MPLNFTHWAFNASQWLGFQELESDAGSEETLLDA